MSCGCNQTAMADATGTNAGAAATTPPATTTPAKPGFFSQIDGKAPWTREEKITGGVLAAAGAVGLALYFWKKKK